MYETDPIIVECDVLIIGGGAAGCWAAIRARDFVERVVIIDKARVSRSGMTTFSAGVMIAPQEGDDFDLWTEEMTERGQYLNNQEWVRLFLEEQVHRIRQLRAWGVPFEVDELGNLQRIKGRGHETTRIVMYHSKKLIERLRDQVIQREVQLFERFMITDLLTSDGSHPTQGRVVGAVGFHCRTGQRYIFRSQATVLAAGGVSTKRGAGYVDNITGDSHAIGFRAGAELEDMEFCTHANIVIWDRKYIAYGINVIQGYGFHLVNAKGERFMENYSPKLLERSKLDTLTVAFVTEVLKGNGPIYADLRHFSSDVFERFYRVIPFTMRVFDEATVNPRESLIEIAPNISIHSSAGNGGLRVNLSCETNIVGLYAAGAACRTPVHGTYSVGGVNIAWANVSGYIAGEKAGLYAKDCALFADGREQALDLLNQAMAPAKRASGPTPDEIFDKTHRAILSYDVMLFKNAEKINKTVGLLEKIEEEAAWVRAEDPHQLVKANELTNYLTCAKLVFLCGYHRTESRGWLYRDDFPYRDDEEWLQWLITFREGNETKFRTIPVPFERYPFKPEKRAKVPVAAFRRIAEV